jgi:microcystin degradation protein MlrC
MNRSSFFLLSCLILPALAIAGQPNGDKPESVTGIHSPQRTAFVAGLVAEIHTSAPFFTRLEDFEEVGSDQFREAAKARGWNMVAGKILAAAPANRVLAPAYQTLKANLLNELRAAMPVDMVVLALHGAMAAVGNDDAEGDLLAAVREIVGPDIPVGAGLDAHAHLSQAMVDAADILVFYKEWPHIDAEETLTRAFELTADVAEGRSNPKMALYDARMVAFYHTLKEPVLSLVNEMKAAEADDEVLVVNFIHGFPYGDVLDMGSKILVITDDAAPKGMELAEHFGRKLFDLRGNTAVLAVDLDEGMDTIVASNNHPVVVADYADTVFGGTPGDATFVLKALLDRGIGNAIIAGLWDPMSIDMIEGLTPGSRINLRIGGKTGPVSGDPLDLEVEVRYVGKDLWLKNGHQEMGSEGEGVPVGAIAVVRADSGKMGIDIVLVEKRYPIYGYKALESLGLHPRDSRVIVVKSSNNFYDGYEAIAGDVVYVMSPGLLSRVIDLKPLKMQRPKWPFDEHPFD